MLAGHHPLGVKGRTPDAAQTKPLLVLSNQPTDDLTGWTATATAGFGGGL